jgi:3-mercaptopyruvate sulfurtransferase SseA
MQFILTIMLTLVFGLSMLQCQSSTTTSKPETVKTDAQTTNTAPVAKTNSATEHSDEHVDDAPRINLADAKKDFDAGNVVFVDTRAEASYRTEHIKGAINVPAQEIQTRYTEVPKGKKIIAYCS